MARFKTPKPSNPLVPSRSQVQFAIKQANLGTVTKISKPQLEIGEYFGDWEGYRLAEVTKDGNIMTFVVTFNFDIPKDAYYLYEYEED